MILPIILLCILVLLISFILFFQEYFFVPAVEKQTKVDDNEVFSKIETSSFNIFNTEEKINEVTSKAFVLCSCEKEFKNRSDVLKLSGGSCSIVTASSSSVTDCKFACIGLGDCAKVCAQQAIMITNKTAVISELCNGCGRCVNVCPKQLIKLVPVGEKHIPSCKNEKESLTSCSKFKKSLDVIYKEKNNFKFWDYCYKMLFRKK